MRANDCIEIMYSTGQFYKELKRVVYEFSYYRNDKSGTESLYNLYLVQDKIRKLYNDDLNDWKLNNPDKTPKPIYIENDLGISYEIASHFRDLLFKVIENDKSFGYLFYLLASEKNRIEPVYQDNPIECIPDKKIIEESIINYQDDYPKKSLEEYLTYCDFNYSFYKSNKKLFHTQDFWFTVFTNAYNLFDNLRAKMMTPLLAYDYFKEYCRAKKNKKILITTLVIRLLEQYNFDLSEEQLRGKTILVDEIQHYLDLLNADQIPADPLVRSIGWLSEHPELMTIQEQQDLNNSLKAFKEIGNNIKYKFPTFELVKSKIDEIPDIDGKILLLEDVIATWKVNMQIAIKLKNDITAKEIGENKISLFNDLLTYWKKMKELDIAEKKSETVQNSQKKDSLKPRTFLDDRRENYELSNSPLTTTAIKDVGNNRFRKLTEQDVEFVKANCIALNDIFTKGLDFFESYFSTNTISAEDVKFLKSQPFSGILSDNYFNIFVLSHFDDSVVLGTIFEMCFGQTVNRIITLEYAFCTTPDINNDPKIKELLKIIFFNNNNSILIKDNLLTLAKEIREFIKLVYSYTKNKNISEGINLKILQSNNFFDEFSSENNYIELKDVNSVTLSNPNEDITSESISIQQTKSTILKEKLTKYGFFDLAKVKKLSHENQMSLVDKLVINGIPYAIAMFDHIEYFKLLDSQYFKTNKKRNIEIATWFNSNERSIRGNKDALFTGSKEKKMRYTAHLHKENVENDYKILEKEYSS